MAGTDQIAYSAESVVNKAYYSEGAIWEDDVIRSLKRSRSLAWTAAFMGWTTAALSLTALLMLFPLKQFEPYVIEVDKTTGYLEVARALQPGPLQGDQAVTAANLVRYIRARETYDPRMIKDNFDLAALYSDGAARADLFKLYAPNSATRPDKMYGKDTEISVEVKSVSLLNTNTATVRFGTTEKAGQKTTDRAWVAVIRFRYTGEPMKNEWRFDNPLGFQVTEYRRDQESIGNLRGTAQ